MSVRHAMLALLSAGPVTDQTAPVPGPESLLTPGLNR